MAKTELNVEKLPLKVDGKIEMVPRRQYANHKASELAIRHKQDVKKTQVSDMIDMIVAGKELEADNEPIWVTVYDEIKKDIELAQERNKEAVEEANRKAEETKTAEAEKAAEAKRLVEVAHTVDIGETFANLSKNFDLGNMDRCIVKGNVSDELVVGALVAGLKMEEFSNWAKGDLVLELEKRGRENVMVELCKETGIPYKSIYRMAITAKNVPPDKRDKNVPFTTYAEVANARFSKDEAEDVKKREATLALVAPKAADEKKNVGKVTTALEARKAVQAAQGKEPPKAPDPNAVNDEKDLFLIIIGGDVKKSIGFPTSLEADENVMMIIHAKTARKAYGTGAKRKWTALDEHKEPEPKKEEKKEDKKKDKKGAKKGGAKKKK